ncbi:hypothetical protein AC578_8648 [Pseudocercospora eumusae]|uniref:Cytochrome P450 n=1 Tax=Pseudocercospora eumusae TaxID=321146 RepID=A0A139HPQ6_9PEZI|nr:hypothetical protein AC578_8648 [Pseudocercospora eumusae]
MDAGAAAAGLSKSASESPKQRLQCEAAQIISPRRSNPKGSCVSFGDMQRLKSYLLTILGFDHNSRAAPMRIFGLGIRGCYGKRLAYLEMRVVYALVLWRFELLPIADSIGDFKGTDVMSHQPQHARIRLSPAQRGL